MKNTTMKKALLTAARVALTIKNEGTKIIESNCRTNINPKQTFIKSGHLTKEELKAHTPNIYW